MAAHPYAAHVLRFTLRTAVILSTAHRISGNTPLAPSRERYPLMNLRAFVFQDSEAGRGDSPVASDSSERMLTAVSV
jgi:hypothetical protein